MRAIEQYTYSNRLARVNPFEKAGLAAVIIALCLGLNRPLVGVAAILWVILLTVAGAGVPVVIFVRVLLAEAFFLMLTTLGVAISVSWQLPEQVWTQGVGPIWISASPASLALAAQLVSRALGSAAALNSLAFTTPLVDIVVLLRRLRLPESLIDVLMVMARFLFVLFDMLERMMTAQEARLGYQTNWRRSFDNAALIGARLFTNAIERSRRLDLALAARGYDGTLRVVTPCYQRYPRFGPIVIAISASLVLAWQVDRWLF